MRAKVLHSAAQCWYIQGRLLSHQWERKSLYQSHICHLFPSFLYLLDREILPCFVYNRGSCLNIKLRQQLIQTLRHLQHTGLHARTVYSTVCHFSTLHFLFNICAQVSVIFDLFCFYMDSFKNIWINFHFILQQGGDQVL